MDWKLERDLGFMRLESKKTDEEKYDIIIELNKKLSAIGRDMARDLMPSDAKR